MNMAKISFLLLMAFLTLTHAQDLSWYNDTDDAFELSNATKLNGLRQLVNNGNAFEGKTIKLASNIALAGNWTPIGNDTNHFRGTFDGQSNTISGLSVDSVQYAGLFGYVGTNGQIKNLNVIATKIRSVNYAGGLAGYYNSAKAIESCSVRLSGMSVQVSAVGSVARKNTNNPVAVSSSRSLYFGGLVGYANGTITITSSYLSGDMSFSGSASGERYSYSSGGIGSATSITATGSLAIYSGGLVGYANGTTIITDSYDKRKNISFGF
ncbi:MAG: hypothetical protein FWC26_00225 [Fibromonadales bacterium]|nr:hypothetical protein [Fibromonadales bacterium]